MRNKKLATVLGLLVVLVLILGACSAKEEEEVAEKEESMVEKEEEIIVIIEEEEIEDEEIEAKVDASQEISDEHSYDIEIGKLAPNFTLENLDGEEVSLEDYRGKIVMLNFWATWCPYCVREMPDMDKLQKENDDFVILAVDVKEEKAKVEKYINEGGYEFEVLLDIEGDTARTYLISNYPTSYFIDKEGILIGGIPGMLEYPQMKEILELIRGNE